MGEDPFSMACNESKSISFNSPKSPKTLKKVDFFSKAGKGRLQKIWDDNHLSEERVFTGISEPGDSYVRERVSDFVQAYLFRRARRLSLGRKAINPECMLGGFWKGKKIFQEYENCIMENNVKHDKTRMDEEVKRITDLLISGKIKHAPEEFQNVFQDPIYKINRLMESVNKLEHSEIKVKAIPFEVRTTKIKSVKEKDFQNVNSRGSLKMEVIKQTLETEGILKRSALISESDALSISSGFDDVESSDFISKPSPGILHSRSSGYFAEHHSSIDQERDRSFSIISELSDQDLFDCAEKQYSGDEITGDLEISAEFSWEHPPLSLMKNENNCNVMYNLASGVVGMYQRQEVVGDEFNQLCCFK